MHMLLACGSMHFGPGFQFLIFATAVLWLAGIIAAITSPILMTLRPSIANPGHILFWLGCLAFGGFGWKINQLGGSHDGYLLLAYIYGAPILPLAHFAYLFRRHWTSRPQRPAHSPEAQSFDSH